MGLKDEAEKTEATLMSGTRKRERERTAVGNNKKVFADESE